MKIFTVELSNIHAWRLEEKPEDDRGRMETVALLEKRKATLDYLNIKAKLSHLSIGESYLNMIMAYTSASFACSGEVVLQLMEMGEKFEVSSTTTVDDFNCTLDRFQKLVDKIDSAVSGINTGEIYNDKCEVHMPGQALATYNETLLLEDSCTDVLQGALDKGWRVITACPMPDKRRPDYILGRFNPEHEVGARARRDP
jgi:hypothetical protein